MAERVLAESLFAWLNPPIPPIRVLKAEGLFT
jgi:hypothetical protein